MAILIKKDLKLDIPHEPGEWITVRVPLTTKNLRNAKGDGSEVAIGLDMVLSAIVAWSYPEPITRDNLDNLDLETTNWLWEVTQEHSGLRSDAEKKESNGSSSPTTEQAEQPSLQSLGT